jgi:ribosomal protein L24
MDERVGGWTNEQTDTDTDERAEIRLSNVMGIHICNSDEKKRKKRKKKSQFQPKVASST